MFQYAGPTVSSNQSIFLGPNGGTLEVSNAATTLTLTGYIGGFQSAEPRARSPRPGRACSS